MARLTTQLLTLSALLLPLLSSASPIKTDPELRSFIKAERSQSDSSFKPIEVNRRQRRHLRVDLEPRAATPVDNGGMVDFGTGAPVPVRGNNGLPFYHKSNTPVDKENIDNIAPPPSDAGTVPNLKWSFSLSHMRLLNGGWVREQAITDLPPSKDFSAVEGRLGPNANRELHWQRIAEWGYVLNGTGRVAGVDENGKNFLQDIHGPTSDKFDDGSMWYFPPGVPHSIQALDTGIEFLVVFADGNFDALGTTFQLSDWLVHTPKDILAQNFGIKPEMFDNMPAVDPWLLPSLVAPPQMGHAVEQAIASPQGGVPNPYVWDIGSQEAVEAAGGWAKIQDSVTNFHVSQDVASALIYVKPGALREMHWHREDEWMYIINGQARVTAFAGSSSSRTFDFGVGDTGVLPVGYGHYVKNPSATEPLVYLELFKSPKFADFSATQFISLVPHQIPSDLLRIPKETIDGFAKTKQIIVA